MVKSELVARLAEKNPHLYQRDVERIVTTIFEEISSALSRGDRVELRGFGAFSVKQRAPRVARNPRTGQAVQVGEKHIPSVFGFSDPAKVEYFMEGLRQAGLREE